MCLQETFILSGVPANVIPSGLNFIWSKGCTDLRVIAARSVRNEGANVIQWTECLGTDYWHDNYAPAYHFVVSNKPNAKSESSGFYRTSGFEKTWVLKISW